MVGVIDRPLYACDLFDSEMPSPIDSAAPVLILARRTVHGSLRIRMLHDPEVVDAQVANNIFDQFMKDLRAIADGQYHVNEPSFSDGESCDISSLLKLGSTATNGGAHVLH